MKRFVVILVAALSAAGAAPASAQLVSERTDATDRICVYQARSSSDAVREYRVGLGELCPAYPRTRSRVGLAGGTSSLASVPAPPTARLLSAVVQNGRRRCIYGQRGGSWTFDSPLDQYCPLTAGLMIARQSQEPGG
jgi:hypothetical protein